MDLKELLTQNVTADKKPLFLTTTALSDAIIAQKKNGYSNKRSVNTLLGFIFSKKRPCPNTLQSLILDAVRARLSKESPQLQNEWEQRISETIDFLNQEIKKSDKIRSKQHQDHFEHLVKNLEAAEKVFIVTPTTAEQETGIKRADQLNEILLKRLGIYPVDESLPKAKYWFLLPSRETGNNFWIKLREKALQAFNEVNKISWIEQRINFLADNGYLNIVIVPSFICHYHFVVFNPDYTRNCVGFSYVYYPDNLMEATPWDIISISQWKENIYQHFHWQNPKTKIPFTTKAESTEFMKEHPDDFAGYLCPVPFLKSH